MRAYRKTDKIWQRESVKEETAGEVDGIRGKMEGKRKVERMKGGKERIKRWVNKKTQRGEEERLK